MPPIQAGFRADRGFRQRSLCRCLSNGGDEHELYGAAHRRAGATAQDLRAIVLPPDKPLHAYDETALVAETDLMTEWFLPLALGRAATADEMAQHRQHWREVLNPVLAAPSVFVHRDYHAQNLMWLPEREGSPASASSIFRTRWPAQKLRPDLADRGCAARCLARPRGSHDQTLYRAQAWKRRHIAPRWR